MSGFRCIGTQEDNPELFAAFETLIGERAVPSDKNRQAHLQECLAVVLIAMDQAGKRPQDAALALHLNPLETPNIDRLVCGSDDRCASKGLRHDIRETLQVESSKVLT